MNVPRRTNLVTIKQSRSKQTMLCCYVLKVEGVVLGKDETEGKGKVYEKG